jgi:alpha-galactosidase
LDVIAIDQDRTGVQGRRIWKQGAREVRVKPLAGGGRAVLLFNRGAGPADIGFTREQPGSPGQLKARLRDVRAHRDLPRRSGTSRAVVGPYGVVMLRIQP